mmetsp:Transcript_448/g.864  ORF Transcript_448/g.864 Transcript_448/m.864 type:complete len:184 (+) Transcript_448:61-612(+)
MDGAKEDSKARKRRRSSSSSSENSDKRRRRRAKERKYAFSNFSAFDKEGENFTGKTFEQKTAEEELEELMNGGAPLNLKQRDAFKRRQATEEKAQMERAQKENAAKKAADEFAKEAAAEAAKMFPFKNGDKVEIFGLKSEAGQKLNGKLAQVTRYEPSGRVMVEMLRGLSAFHSVKPENLRRC